MRGLAKTIEREYMRLPNYSGYESRVRLTWPKMPISNTVTASMCPPEYDTILLTNETIAITSLFSQYRDARSSWSGVLRFMPAEKVGSMPEQYRLEILTPRRLRCDRTEQCNNCVARKVECKYSLATRSRPLAQRQQGSQPQLEGRLRHLEQLIGTLVAERSSSNELQSTTSNRDASDSAMLGGPALRPSPSGQPSDSDSAALDDVKPGRIVESNSQMTFVSSDHWKAIQDEVRTLFHT